MLNITNERFIEMMKQQMKRSKTELELRFLGKRVKFPGTAHTGVHTIEEISLNMHYGVIFRLKNDERWWADSQLVFLEEATAS